jgi:hypothetical protein
MALMRLPGTADMTVAYKHHPNAGDVSYSHPIGDNAMWKYPEG